MEGERKRERETLLSYCQASVCLRHTVKVPREVCTTN